jgi:hypothetical protein
MVNDAQVASLRAFLALEPDKGLPLTKNLLPAGDVDGYGQLIYAALVIAVRRGFSTTWTVPNPLRLAAAVRVRLLSDGIEIDPRVAETLMRRVLGDTVTGELGEEARARAQIFLLVELVLDEDLDDRELDDFLVMARTMADHVVNKRADNRDPERPTLLDEATAGRLRRKYADSVRLLDHHSGAGES